MTKRVMIRCTEPKRKDALEETARLALAYVTLGSGPKKKQFDFRNNLVVQLSASALRDGCHLSETAQVLLEALGHYGVRVERVGDDEVAENWNDWWTGLNEPSDEKFDLTLEIV